MLIGVPEGLRDRLPGECRRRREREAGLAELFCKHGFLEVATPVFERYDLFVRTGSPIAEETMVKFIDRSGRVCVLRPDNTAPIARLAATRLQNEPLPLKVWTMQPVYRAGGDGGRYEIPQAGAEAIGVTDDAEVLRLAYEVTQSYFQKTPHIEVSHAGILQKLCGALGVEDERTILSLIERKNFAALGDELPSNNPAAADILALTRLSGGAEVLEEASRVSKTPLDKPLTELRELMNKLPEGMVTVDFGLAPSIGYYTGVFFRGYVEGAAAAVLSGGRYDHLLGLLGRRAPAAGFAVDIETGVY